MGEYIKNKKDMRFQSIEALQVVEDLINEANEGIQNKNRKIKDSPISEVLGGAIGMGVGAGVGFAGLYFGGTVGLSAAGITSGLATAGSLVGGGMAVGISVLAAPAAIAGGVGVGLVMHHRNKRLRESKELLYKEALAKQTALIKALEEEASADKERIEYLNGLIILLQQTVKDLQYDLGIAA